MNELELTVMKCIYFIENQKEQYYKSYHKTIRAALRGNSSNTEYFISFPYFGSYPNLTSDELFKTLTKLRSLGYIEEKVTFNKGKYKPLYLLSNNHNFIDIITLNRKNCNKENENIEIKRKDNVNHNDDNNIKLRIKSLPTVKERVNFLFDFISKNEGLELDLSGVNFKGANLSGINLTNANLSNANLSNANLSRAIIDNAKLKGTNFNNTNLYKVDLRKVSLNETNIHKARLIEIPVVKFDEFGVNKALKLINNVSDVVSKIRSYKEIFPEKPMDLSGLDLRGADLIGINLSGSNLQKSNLGPKRTKHWHKGGKVLGAWRGAVYYEKGYYFFREKETNLSNANLSNVNLQEANLEKANLEKANLTNADLRGSKMRDANISYAILKKANFTGVEFKYVKRKGADLKSAIGIKLDIYDKIFSFLFK